VTGEPGSSKDQPFFMRLVYDEDDAIKWGNVLVMLGLTVLSGYLAARSQRAGSMPDTAAMIRMRIARAGEQLGGQITRAGVALSIASCRAYDRERPV
jgi:hypothetical protein